jgi:hypothetical protein
MLLALLGCAISGFVDGPPFVADDLGLLSGAQSNALTDTARLGVGSASQVQPFRKPAELATFETVVNTRAILSKLHFSNAEQTAEHGVAANDGLVEFARRYLRKIVNVVVRIPRMTSEQSKTFVSRDAMVDREEEKITAHSSLRAYGAWGLATIVAVVLPLLLAQEVVPPGGTGPAATQQQTPAQNPPSADNSAPQPLTGAPAPNAAPQQPPLEELYVKAATPGRPSWWSASNWRRGFWSARRASRATSTC